jgi:hypothetical protein
MNVSNRKNRNIGLPIFIFATSCNEEILQKKFCISLLLASTKRVEISIYIFLGFRNLSEIDSGIRPLFSPEITEDRATGGARVGSGSGAQL